MLASYTITAIDGDDYTVAFTFGDGGTSTQTIHFGTVDSAETLDAMVRAYATAYLAGLAAAAAPAASPLAHLIGVAQTPQG